MQDIAFRCLHFLNFFIRLEHFGVLSLVEFGYLLESLNLLIVLRVLVSYTMIIFSLLIDFCPYILLLLICGLQIGKNKDHVLYHFQMLIVIFLRLEIISSLLEHLKHVPPL
jgi:hypothetical protein